MKDGGSEAQSGFLISCVESARDEVMVVIVATEESAAYVVTDSTAPLGGAFKSFLIADRSNGVQTLPRCESSRTIQWRIPKAQHVDSTKRKLGSLTHQ